MSRVWVREHVPRSKPLPLVDVRRGEGDVTVRERAEDVKSAQHNNNQETTACVQHPLKSFKSGERKEEVDYQPNW